MANNRRQKRRQRGLAVRSSPSHLEIPPQQTQNFTPGPGQLRRGWRQVSAMRYSGPLPHPDILQGIENACQGGADRVIGQMEEQGRHRRKLEEIVVTGDDRREDKGQLYGFILCMVVVLSGVFLVYNGINIAGYGALIAGLGIPASLFVYKKLEAKKELQDKKDKIQKRPPDSAA